MKRKIYDKLIKWKNDINKKPMIVLGVNKCGKTYIINEFCKNEFKNVCKVNLLKQHDIVELFSQKIDFEEMYKIFKVKLPYDIDDKDTILFIDEIQESEELISYLKAFCEDHNNVNIICAGSLLDVKLNRFHKSFPVGKVWMIDMYPMDFEEYLWARGKCDYIKFIKESFENNEPIFSFFHQDLIRYYHEYLFTGGMPQSVQNFVDVNFNLVSYDTNILKRITSHYYKDMKKFVINSTESLKIKDVYKSLPRQLMNKSGKFQLSKVNKIARSRGYELSIDWLIHSEMILKCNLVTLPEIPLRGFIDFNIFKFYLSDVGILCNMLNLGLRDIFFDNFSNYGDIIAKNFVANQLTCNGIDLYYWKSSATAEVDFLLRSRDGVIPIEVKGKENAQSKSLKVYMEKYKPKYAIKISEQNFGYDHKTRIKTIPLYAVFLIKDN